MPTYEYRCKNCGEHLEVVQSFKDEPLKVCPSCDGELRKVFSPIGISFKGSGFYKTDSRSSSSGRSAGRGESGSESAASSDSSKSADGSKSADTAKSSDTTSSKPASEPKAATAS